MMEILLSRIKALPFDFEGAVDAHIAALEAHRFTEGEAAPAPPHPLVEAAIGRKQYPVEDRRPDDFVRAYEVIDDTPPPPTLEERKQALANEAMQGAAKARAVITPPLKANHWSHQLADALAVDEKKRTPEQHAAVLEHGERQKRLDAVHRHLAKLCSDIHDLDETTIETWKPDPFNGL